MTTDVTSKQTEAVLQRHLGAVMKAGTEGVAAVPAILADYTDESVIMTPDAVFTGLAGVKSFLEGFITSVPADLIPSIKLTRQEVRGEVAYLVYTASPYIPLGTDTFVIRDGKIAVQTFAVYMPS